MVITLMMTRQEKLSAYRDLVLDLLDFRTKYTKDHDRKTELKLYEIDYLLDQIYFKIRKLERDERYGI